MLFEKTKPILGKGKSKLRVNPEFLRRCDLKKQTQFLNGQIGVKSYLKGDYDINANSGAEKNKANYKYRIGRRVDSRLRGNDKYGISARRKILTLFEKTKPIYGCVK